MVFHVLNLGFGRQTLFRKPADYSAFEDCVKETLDKVPMRICAYCVMPNHWHFALWPGTRWRSGPVHAALDGHPRDSLAEESPSRRSGACVPRSL